MPVKEAVSASAAGSVLENTVPVKAAVPDRAADTVLNGAEPVKEAESENAAETETDLPSTDQTTDQTKSKIVSLKDRLQNAINKIDYRNEETASVHQKNIESSLQGSLQSALNQKKLKDDDEAPMFQYNTTASSTQDVLVELNNKPNKATPLNQADKWADITQENAPSNSQENSTSKQPYGEGQEPSEKDKETVLDQKEDRTDLMSLPRETSPSDKPELPIQTDRLNPSTEPRIHLNKHCVEKNPSTTSIPHNQDSQHNQANESMHSISTHSSNPESPFNFKYKHLSTQKSLRQRMNQSGSLVEKFKVQKLKILKKAESSQTLSKAQFITPLKLTSPRHKGPKHTNALNYTPPISKELDIIVEEEWEDEEPQAEIPFPLGQTSDSDESEKVSPADIPDQCKSPLSSTSPNLDVFMSKTNILENKIDMLEESTATYRSTIERMVQNVRDARKDKKWKNLKQKSDDLAEKVSVLEGITNKGVKELTKLQQDQKNLNINRQQKAVITIKIIILKEEDRRCSRINRKIKK